MYGKSHSAAAKLQPPASPISVATTPRNFTKFWDAKSNLSLAPRSEPNDEQACHAEPRHPWRGALDQQGQRREAVPMGEVCRRSRADARHHPVRARLLDGVATDLRPAGARPRRILGHGFLR